MFNLFSFDPVISLNGVFRSLQTFLDLGVHVADHFGEVVDKILLVGSSILIFVWVLQELVLEEVVMALLARTCVVPGVWEQVVRAEA